MARRALATMVALAWLDACSSSNADPASFDASLDPASLVAPDLACGADSAVTYDPCLHMVVCVGGDGVASSSTAPFFAVTYYGGSCAAGQCTFSAPPTIEPCRNGCFGGPSGRCTRAGPTAP